MRLFFIFFIAIAAIFIVATAGFYYWLAYYNGDLPDVSSMAQFSPITQGTAIDTCNNTSIAVVPSNAFGKYLPDAITTVEDFDISATILKTVSQAASDVRSHHSLPLQLARLLICTPGKSLDHQFKTIRLAIRLERKFTNQQLLAIYMNRVYFGQDLKGVFAASQSYFGEAPDQLNLAKSVTLAALIQAPSFYLNQSPTNCFLVEMTSWGKWSTQEGSLKKNYNPLNKNPSQI